MLPAVQGCLAAPDIKRWSGAARVMGSTPVDDVHHAVLGMLLAVHRLLVARDIEGRHLRAGVMRAK